MKRREEVTEKRRRTGQETTMECEEGIKKSKRRERKDEREEKDHGNSASKTSSSPFDIQGVGKGVRVSKKVEYSS